eukprot:EG_transcript_29104
MPGTAGHLCSPTQGRPVPVQPSPPEARQPEQPGATTAIWQRVTTTRGGGGRTLLSFRVGPRIHLRCHSVRVVSGEVPDQMGEAEHRGEIAGRVSSNALAQEQALFARRGGNRCRKPS